jgi:hypothetical protein
MKSSRLRVASYFVFGVALHLSVIARAADTA